MVVFSFIDLCLQPLKTVHSRHKPERIDVSHRGHGFAGFCLFPNGNTSVLCFPVGRWHLVGSASHAAAARPAKGPLLGYRVNTGKELCSLCRGMYKTHGQAFEQSKLFESRLVAFGPLRVKAGHCLVVFSQETLQRET